MRKDQKHPRSTAEATRKPHRPTPHPHHRRRRHRRPSIESQSSAHPVPRGGREATPSSHGNQWGRDKTAKEHGLPNRKGSQHPQHPPTPPDHHHATRALVWRQKPSVEKRLVTTAAWPPAAAAGGGADVMDGNTSISAGTSDVVKCPRSRHTVVSKAGTETPYFSSEFLSVSSRPLKTVARLMPAGLSERCYSVS